MKKPEELEMSVLTVPNGYSLDLRRGGKESGYLYFTLPQLLEGILYHVGFGEAGSEERDTVSALVEGAMAWRDHSGQMKRLLTCETEIKALRHSVSIRDAEIVERKNVIRNLREELASMRERIKQLEAAADSCLERRKPKCEHIENDVEH